MARPISALVGAATRCAAHRSGPGETRTKEQQMSGKASSDTRILGSLRSAEGVGVVRIEDRYDTDIDDLWSAITDPDRLARWFGDVDGELSLGGEFRVHIADAGERTGQVEACDAPQRLLVTTRETEESYRRGQGVPPFDAAWDITLTADGDQPPWSLRSRACPWTRSPSSEPAGRSTPKTSPHTSPAVKPTTSRHAAKNSSLPIRTWPPTSASTRRQHSRDIPARWPRRMRRRADQFPTAESGPNSRTSCAQRQATAVLAAHSSASSCE